MSIFKSERSLFESEKVWLARALANKTENEIYEVLDEEPYVLYRLPDPVPGSVWYRMLRTLVFVPATLSLLSLSVVRYIMTGDRYLNAWADKYSAVRWLMEIYEGK